MATNVKECDNVSCSST